MKVKAFKDDKTDKFYYEGAGLTKGGGNGGRLENRPNLGYTFIALVLTMLMKEDI